MNKGILYFFCALIILFSSCHGRKDKVEKEPHWFKFYSAFNQAEYQELFEQEFHNQPVDTRFQNAVKQYYASRNNKPIWTINGWQEHKIDTLLSYLDKAYEHGIPDEFLGVDSLLSRIDSLKQHLIPNNSQIHHYLIDIEFTLTNAYLRYATALRYGATDPKRVNGNKWFYQYQTPDSVFFLESLTVSESIIKALQQLQPTDNEYQQLQREIVRLHNIKDTAFTRIPTRTISIGQQDPAVKFICKRLKLTGELSANQPDTNVLTQKVLDAVNTFRSDNNIPTCDSLSIETIDKLNRPIRYYIDKLSANMERLRWQIVPQKGKNRIVVNLPNFALEVYCADTLAFKTKICCGKTQNPKNTPERHQGGLITPFKAETPLLYSEINTIILNPEWNVPYDIIKNEYYYKLCKSNTACIYREKMLIRDARTGQYILPESINWTKVNQKNIPYRLIQTSGYHNALGRIKFNFPNSESVYLHDTNNKRAFKSHRRAFSHGCIRVENPFELAAIIYEINGFDSLQTERYDILVGKEPITEEGEKYLKKIQEQDSINEANLTDAERPFYRKLKPTSIPLRNKMPLFIEYRTCFINENQRIQYCEDLYYKDENILTLLHRTHQ